MGCTPSKKELEKQTGEKPGDYPDATDGKHGKQKNGNIKKNNEIKAKAAPVVTLTPNGEGPQVGLRISTFDGIPADIKFIDADEESLLRASMQDISASEAVSGKMDPSREDDSKRKELEDRIESMIEPHVEASVQAAPKDSTPNKSVVVQETVTTVTKEGEDGTVEQRTTVVTTETVNKGKNASTVVEPWSHFTESTSWQYLLSFGEVGLVSGINQSGSPYWFPYMLCITCLDPQAHGYDGDEPQMFLFFLGSHKECCF